MTETKHTRLPWVHIPLEGSQGIYPAKLKQMNLYRDRIAELPQWATDLSGQTISGQTKDQAIANAAFIIKACNSFYHDKADLKTLAAAYLSRDVSSDLHDLARKIIDGGNK